MAISFKNPVRTFITILLIATPILGSGQAYLGFRGGYSMSGVFFNPNRNEKPLLDNILDFGIVAKHSNLKHIGFQAELNYTQRGYRSLLDNGVTYKRVNTYLDFPLFFQLKTQWKGAFAHINVGFYMSYLLNATHGNNEGGTYKLTPYNFNILRDNRFDFGLPGGVGIGYNSPWGTIQVDIRYFFGMGDLYYYDYSGNPLRSPAWVQNASVSYLLNLKSFSRRSKQEKQTK